MYEQTSTRFCSKDQGARGGDMEGEQGISGKVGEVIHSGTESVQRVFSEYPLSTILGCFALGATAGVAIGLLLTERPEPRWHERFPESFYRGWESFLHSLPETVRSKVS